MQKNESAIAQLGEALPVGEVHERHFGNIEFAVLELNPLIDLSQIRGKANPRLQELQESIDNEDLDNPINVVRVNQREFEEYLNFTNKTWDGSARVEDYVHLQQQDGSYNLLVAGHSRTNAMRGIAEAYTNETGIPTNYTVLCKMLPATDVWTIVSKQYTENLHSNVSQERSAMAIVELYFYGLGIAWDSPEEFKTFEGRKTNKRMVDDALAFVALSTEVRTSVFTGYLPYKAGVQLGRAMPTIREWLCAEVGIQENEFNEEIEALVKDNVLSKVAYICKRNLNSIASAAYIKGFVEKMRADVAAKAEASENSQGAAPQESLFAMASPVEQLRQMQRQERLRLAGLLREATEHPLYRAAETVGILTSGRPGSELLAVVKDARDAYGELLRATGRAATLHAVHPVEPVQESLVS